VKNEIPFTAIDAISILFTDTLPQKTDTEDMNMFYAAQMNNPVGNIISDTSNWTRITGNFFASGERYFTVGTFKQESEINKYYFGMPNNNLSYYFFDNFSLCPCSDTIPPEGPPNVVFIPNVFSPNGDGENDNLYIRGENIKELTFSIYSRWGELVFESTDLNAGWDGTYKGKPCDPAVYIYHVKLVFNDGTEQEKKGNVTVVR
jgi:gliding motility-associated-like protein